MAYDIKELTKEIHQNAERQEFVKTLMSGTIRPELYAIYLDNQLQCYSVLEKNGMANDLFRQTPGLQRAENIHKDYEKTPLLFYLEDKQIQIFFLHKTNRLTKHLHRLPQTPLTQFYFLSIFAFLPP